MKTLPRSPKAVRAVKRLRATLTEREFRDACSLMTAHLFKLNDENWAAREVIAAREAAQQSRQRKREPVASVPAAPRVIRPQTRQISLFDVAVCALVAVGPLGVSLGLFVAGWRP